jgi:flavin-dependent dehydrogenase
MTEYDIAIVGGGLAGCAAAITVLQSEPRAKILVLERGIYPRHKVCGEFVSPEGMAALARLLGAAEACRLASHAPEITQANIRVDGRVLSAPIRPAAAGITRLDLDFALWRQATKLGADVRERSSVLRVEGSGPFEIQLEHEQVNTQALINAAGRWSIFTQRLVKNTNGRHDKWIGLKCHFAEPAVSGTIDLYLFESGYCGVQSVAADRVNACAMVRADAASTLAEVCALHPELKERSRHWTPVIEPVTTAPLYFRNPVPVENMIFNAGDAAGFIDPFVGDGMTLALHSAILAGEALVGFVEKRCNLPSAAQSYDREYRTRLLPAFRRARWVRKMIYLPSVVRIPLGRIIQMTGATESLLKATRITG